MGLKPLLVVSGGAGFVGRHLLELAGRAGWPLLAVLRRPPPSPLPAPWHVQPPGEPGALLPPGLRGRDFVLVDLAWDLRRRRDPAVQAAFARRLGPLLRAWTGRGLLGAVVAGSVAEYGLRGGLLREEDPPAGPLDPYMEAKIRARRDAASWARESGLPLVWLRLFHTYGPGQEGELLVPYLLRCFRRGEAALLGSGRPRRDFLYVEDAARALLLAAERLPSGVNVLNAGTGRALSVAEVARRLARACGAEHLLRLGARPDPPGEPLEQRAETRRIRELLGWEARVSPEEGLERCCRETRRE